MARTMPTAAALAVLASPWSRKRWTDHCRRGATRCSLSWPLCRRRRTETATRAATRAPATADATATFRRPRGPRASAMNGAVTRSPADRHLLLQPRHRPPRGQGQEEVEEGGPEEHGDGPAGRVVELDAQVAQIHRRDGGGQAGVLDQGDEHAAQRC